MSVEKFRMVSSIHSVKENGEGFTIESISDSELDLGDFQSIAKETEQYVGPDYWTKVHVNGDTGVGLIDLVSFFRKKKDDNKQ